MHKNNYFRYDQGVDCLLTSPEVVAKVVLSSALRYARELPTPDQDTYIQLAFHPESELFRKWHYGHNNHGVIGHSQIAYVREDQPDAFTLNKMMLANATRSHFHVSGITDCENDSHTERAISIHDADHGNKLLERVHVHVVNGNPDDRDLIATEAIKVVESFFANDKRFYTVAIPA